MEQEQLAFDAFIAEHGGNPIQNGQGELLLPDGARVITNGPLLRKPPTDPLRCRQLRLAYAKSRFDQATTLTEHFHSICGNGGGVWNWNDKVLGPAPAQYRQAISAVRKDWDAENAIKARLAEIVAERKAALKEAEAELKELKIPVPI